MNNMLSRFTFILLLALAPFGTASASLVGDTIHADGLFITPGDISPTGPDIPNIFGNIDTTIGDGIEFKGIFGYLNFDFSASTLTITTTEPNLDSIGWSGYGNYVFSQFDQVITGLSIASNSGFTGSILDNFSFTADSISLNFDNGIAFNNVGTRTPASIVFNIATNEVPEPGTLSLILFGILGFATVLRRKA